MDYRRPVRSLVLLGSTTVVLGAAFIAWSLSRNGGRSEQALGFIVRVAVILLGCYFFYGAGTSRSVAPPYPTSIPILAHPSFGSGGPSTRVGAATALAAARRLHRTAPPVPFTDRNRDTAVRSECTG
jgi:hypothetical protein